MSRDPRIAVALCAHVLVTGSSLWLIGTLDYPLSLRLVAGSLAAAILLPWLQSLALRQTERFGWLALLLVLIIGIGIVEVIARDAVWQANILPGAALLEFAILISLSRDQRARAANGSAQR